MMKTGTTKTDLMRQDALDHARNGESMRNYDLILEGFMNKGIDESDILPRENVLTYNAWLALGRKVKAGEHGVKISTFIPKINKKTGERDGVRPCWISTVFHETQTEPISQW